MQIQTKTLNSIKTVKVKGGNAWQWNFRREGSGNYPGGGLSGGCESENGAGQCGSKFAFAVSCSHDLVGWPVLIAGEVGTDGSTTERLSKWYSDGNQLCTAYYVASSMRSFVCFAPPIRDCGATRSTFRLSSDHTTRRPTHNTGWSKKVSLFRVVIKSYRKPVNGVRLFSSNLRIKNLVLKSRCFYIRCVTWFVTLSVTVLEATMWVKYVCIW